MSTEISYNDYLKLQGLAALASEHNRALKVIVRAAASITGEVESPSNYFGHTADEMYSDHPDVGALLRRLDMTVSESVNP